MIAFVTNLFNEANAKKIDVSCDKLLQETIAYILISIILNFEFEVLAESCCFDSFFQGRIVPIEIAD